MRLINTETYLFEEFIGRNIPKYAILSHTWGKEEISFKDMADPLCYQRKGYRKISMSCLIARQADISYVWVDTCCIDKSSSAELTEAINSMFRWYQRSSKCIAFLDDLSTMGSLETDLPRCRWFTRGWTLQELIAPDEVEFYDSGWNFRFSKRQYVGELSKITGIDGTVLTNSASLSSIATAQKMSWAAYRKTTRVEDMAYCLLGLFNVNMPLLYGEEEHAFRRLQEEIIRSTPDLSIFAWRLPNNPYINGELKPRVVCGILADTPLVFADCNSIMRENSYERREFSISNIGIKVRIRIHEKSRHGNSEPRSAFALDCSQTPGKVLGIRLRKYGDDQWVREDPWDLVENIELSHGYRGVPRDIYLLAELPVTSTDPISRYLEMNNFLVRTRSRVLQIRLQNGMYVSGTWPYGQFDHEYNLFLASGNSTTGAGALRIAITGSVGFQNPKSFSFDLMFFAMHWALLDAAYIQCTLVDCESYTRALIEVQSLGIEWDYDSYHILKALTDRKITKCSSICYQIPETKYEVLVSFLTTLVSDNSICSKEFWRVKFDYKILEAGSHQELRQEKWSPPI